MLALTNLKATLKRAVKLYCLFSLGHLIYKWLSLLQYTRTIKKRFSALPGKSIDYFFTELIKNKDRLHDYATDTALQHPEAPLVRLSSPVPEILCNTPEALKWMLKEEFLNVTKPTGAQDYLFQGLTDFLGKDGIFVLRHGLHHQSLMNEHKKWLSQRKTAAKIFTKANFESFLYETFLEKSKKLVEVIDRAAGEGGKVDLQELFFCFTMRSVEKLFWGQEVEDSSEKEMKMSAYGKAFDRTHNAMMQYFMASLPMIVLSTVCFPFPFGKLRVIDDFNGLIFSAHRYFHPQAAIFDKGIEELNTHIAEIIKRTRADKFISERKDIIANFLNADVGNELSDKDLRDIILSLTIAGRDTTAVTMSWLFFELTQNPKVQQKLCEEVDRVLKGKAPTMEDLDPTSMPYLNAVMYETLRLHPPVPENIKVTSKEIQYHDGTVIPKGTILCYFTYAMGRNPSVYESPLQFKPTRWIPFEEPSPFQFPVFQAGPRICLGKDMAKLELRLVTAILLQKFTFKMEPEEARKITYSHMITMSIANDPNHWTRHLWCIPRRR